VELVIYSQTKAVCFLIASSIIIILALSQLQESKPSIRRLRKRMG